MRISFDRFISILLVIAVRILQSTSIGTAVYLFATSNKDEASWKVCIVMGIAAIAVSLYTSNEKAEQSVQGYCKQDKCFEN